MNHDHSPSTPIVLSIETALEVANSRKAVSRESVSAVVGKVAVGLSDDDIARFETSVSNFLVGIGYRQAEHHQVPLNALKTQPLSVKLEPLVFAQSVRFKLEDKK